MELKRSISPICRVIFDGLQIMPHNSPDVLFISDFWSDCATLFEFCTTQIAWDETLRARKTASFGVPYNYSQMTYPAAPMPAPLQSVISQLEPKIGFAPNNCLLNFYADGGASMGFHFDSLENLASGTGVAIVSLGATRELTFRRRDDVSVQKSFALPSGALIYMPPEVQNEWLHGVPKSPEPVGARISLTFRCLADENSQNEVEI